MENLFIGVWKFRHITIYQQYWGLLFGLQHDTNTPGSANILSILVGGSQPQIVFLIDLQIF